MKYKNVEIGDKPTKEQFQEYVSRKGYDIDVDFWYDKYDAKGWQTKRKYPIKSLEAIINVINGIVIRRRNSNRDTNTGKKIKQVLSPKKIEKYKERKNERSRCC